MYTYIPNASIVTVTVSQRSVEIDAVEGIALREEGIVIREVGARTASKTTSDLICHFPHKRLYRINR